MKKFIVVNTRLGDVFQKVVSVDVLKKNNIFLVNGEKYTNDAYSYLNIFNTNNEAILYKNKRNEEKIKWKK